MTAGRVRWGILGAGTIARRFAQDLAHSQTGSLVAVAARSEAKARSFASDLGNVRAYEDFAALTQWGEVDAVYVATPNALHAAHSLLAIKAGKAVLCEKPFADSAAAAQEVADAAQAAGAFCMEAMWTRFLPAMTALKDRLTAGALGTPVHLDISLGFARPETPGDPITDPALGGGALLDLGVYGLSLAEDLLGPFDVVGHEEVSSASGASRSAVLVLRHKIGALSVISVSHETHLTNTLVLSGTSARATLEAPFVQAKRLDIARVTAAVPGAAPSALKMRLLQSRLGPVVRWGNGVIRGPKRITAGFQGSGLQFEIDEVGRCLDRGLTVSPRMPMATTVSILDAMERIKAPNR